MEMWEPDTTIFRVERRGMFCWRVYARWEHGARWVADFWTHGGAQAVADRLNRAAEEYGWKYVFSFVDGRASGD
jgi:hypothetical protein